jgi:polar amino acid transport system substrate-binding protein
MVSPRTNSWFVLLACGFLLPAFAIADTGATDDKVLRFNVSPNGYPPYLINDGEQTSGIMWTVLEEIAGRLGYQLEAHKVPRKRVDQMLLDGVIDGTSRAKEWTSHPENFVFTDPVVTIEEVVFFPFGSPHKFEVVEDLFSLTLVTHLGYHYPRLKPHFESGKIERFDVSRDQDLFVYVLKGDELDAAVADRLVGQWILFTEGMRDQFRASEAALSEVGFRIMLGPEWQSFATDFNRELASMRQNGEIEAILTRYR